MTQVKEPQQVSCLVVTPSKTHVGGVLNFLLRFPATTPSRQVLATTADHDLGEDDETLADILEAEPAPHPDEKCGNSGQLNTRVRIATLQEALTAISEKLYDVIFIDFRIHSGSETFSEPLTIIDEFTREAPGVSLVALLEEEQSCDIDKLLERGISDYLLENELESNTVNRVLRYALSRKQTSHQIFQLLHIDELTGLSNRHLCHDRISQAMIRAERSGQYVAVLLIDLDNFHGINETLGYDVGDYLLKETAKRLVSCVRRQDTVSRFGSDEFVLVLEGLNDPQHATVIAKQILQNFSEPVFTQNQPVFISMSVGISVSEAEMLDGRTLLKQADVARYRAKENGGSNFQYFTPALNTEAQKRLTLERELNYALKKIFNKKGGESHSGQDAPE